MKYLRTFETRQNAIDSSDLIAPNVTYCIENKQLLISEYGITVNTPLEIVADGSTLLKYKSSPSIELVDLGLSSGNLWAKYDFGASETDPFGYYIAWGDSSAFSTTNTSYSGYVRDALKDVEGVMLAFSKGEDVIYIEYTEPEQTISRGDAVWKYSQEAEQDICVGHVMTATGSPLTISYDSRYASAPFDETWYSARPASQIMTNLSGNTDIITLIYGSDYCMPSEEDCEELFALPGQLATRYGIEGYLITGNGEELFFPFAGYCLGDYGVIKKVYSQGRYWVSNITDETEARRFRVRNNDGEAYYSIANADRSNGYSIRAIKKNA